MDAFPAFIPLHGRKVVIIGLGEAADAKARLFDGAPCDLIRLATTGPEGERLSGAALVFIALPAGEELDIAIAAARRSGALVNVVDRPELCDFVTPAIVDRGSVVGAIGTGGAAPVLATRLRQQLESLWPPGLGDLATLLRQAQGRIRACFPDLTARRTFLRHVLDGDTARLTLGGDAVAGAQALEAALADGGVARGGDAWLLTVGDSPDDIPLGDLRRLGTADRLVIQGEINASVMAFARRDAIRQTGASDDDIASWVAAGEDVAILVVR